MSELTKEKVIAVEFAFWIQNYCIQSFEGYIIAGNPFEKLDSNEYQADELFDYWYENVFKPKYQQP